MTRSTAARSTAPSPFNCSAAIADGCATSARRLGAKRAISDAQLASSDAGATRSYGLRLPSASIPQHQQQRQHLDGLAETHVVGEAGAKPEPRQQVQPLHARPLIGTQRPLVIGRVDARRPVRVAQRGERLGEPGTRDGLAPVGIVRAAAPRRRQCRRRPAGASLRRTTGPRRRRAARSPRTAQRAAEPLAIDSTHCRG